MTRPLLIAWLCCLAASAAHCQKTEKYFDYRWHESDASHARFYSLTEKTDSGWLRRNYFIHSLTLQMAGLYLDSACTIASGTFRFIHPTRFIQSKGVCRYGKKHGLWLSYYSDGMLADSTTYDNGNPVGIRTGWYHNGFMRDSASFSRDGSGMESAWFDNGNPSSVGRFTAGYKKHGKWNYFYKAGGISATEIYDAQGHVIEKHYFDEKGTPLADTSSTDRPASFPGGQKAWADYLSGALYLPEQSIANSGDEATVVIMATIGVDGKVSDAEVEVPFYPDFDKIAVSALLHSPSWTPAMDHHRPVSSVIHLPLSFGSKITFR